MALGRMAGARLEPLVRAHLLTDKDERVTHLVRRLRPARERGYLTLADLEEVCNWKSPRAIWQIRRNSAATVRDTTGRALRSRDERARVLALIELQGVSIPMASAVLTLLYPRRYGVIDIRVWQLLHQLGSVSGNGAGVGLRVNDWLQFLDVVRRLSSALRVTARRAERTLFDIHRAHQLGLLYEKRLPNQRLQRRRPQAMGPRR